MRKSVAAILVFSLTSGCTYAIQLPTPDERRIVSNLFSNEQAADPFLKALPAAPSATDADTALQSIANIPPASSAAEPPKQTFDTNLVTVRALAKQSSKYTSLFLHRDYRSSEAFCRNIKFYARSASKSYAALGYILGIGGALGAAAFATIAAHDAKELEKEVGIQGSTAGYGVATASCGALAAVGVYLITRSGAAQKASNHAEQTLSKKDTTEDARFDVCAATRTEWVDASATDVAKIVPTGK